MSENATRLPRARVAAKPAWATVLDTFYAESFDTSSKESLTDCADAFAELGASDRAFHQAHLTYQHVRALEDVHALLSRIEARMPDPAALRYVPGIYKALVVIAKGQTALIDALDSEGGGGSEEDDIIEDEDHGSGDAVVPDLIIPAGGA